MFTQDSVRAARAVACAGMVREGVTNSSPLELVTRSSWSVGDGTRPPRELEFFMGPRPKSISGEICMHDIVTHISVLVKAE